jgi:hypothetical protein
MLGAGQQNLVPNASFECGTDGRGSTEREVLPGWYGTLNGLFGQLDWTTAAHGRTSLRIDLTVAHYKDRVHYWQAFNEPLQTGYSLPMHAGYKVEDYVKYVEAFVEAARRSDPQCKILGGFVGGQLPKEFIALWGLKPIDILTLHGYPGMTPPEYIESVLLPLAAAMREQGACRPIWFTEFAYYADDDCWIEPFHVFVHFYFGGGRHLASERVQAKYLVRIAVTMFAHGVEKIFFHAGTGSAINHGNLWTMFLRYGCEPFRNYPTQAVMAKLLTPDCKFIKKLLADQPLKAYLFGDGKQTVAVIWAPAGTRPKSLRLTNAKLKLWDIVGCAQASRTFTPSESPVYVLGKGVSADEFAKALVVRP